MYKCIRGYIPGYNFFCERMIIMEYSNNLYKYIIHEWILPDFYELIEKYKDDFKGIEVSLSVKSIEGCIKEEMLDHTGRYTKKWVRETLERIISQDSMNIMMTNYRGYADKDGVMTVTNIEISIMCDSLMNLILANLHQLDLLKESLHLSIQHEFGHALDYSGYNGMNISDVKAIHDKEEARKEEFFRLLNDGYYNDPDGIQWDEAYNNLPVEAIANQLAGIDVDEYLKIKRQINDVFDGSAKGTYEINVKLKGE